MSQLRIVVSAIPGTTLAEDKDDARRIRTEQIIPALAAGQDIELDFSEVEFTTQSFVHALISEAIRRHGENVLDRLSFAHCTDEVQQIVLTVVDYTLDAMDAAG